MSNRTVAVGTVGTGRSRGGRGGPPARSRLHDYAAVMYSHPTMTAAHPIPASHPSQSSAKDTAGARACESRR